MATGGDSWQVTGQMSVRLLKDSGFNIAEQTRKAAGQAGQRQAARWRLTRPSGSPGARNEAKEMVDASCDDKSLGAFLWSMLCLV